MNSTAIRIAASPLARRLARERRIDLGAITGGGPGGRITAADVEAAAGAAQKRVSPASMGRDWLTLSTTVRTAALDALAADMADTIDTGKTPQALRTGILALALARALSRATVSVTSISLETATHYAAGVASTRQSAIEDIIAAAKALAPGPAPALSGGSWLLVDYGAADFPMEATRQSAMAAACLILAPGAFPARGPRASAIGHLTMCADLGQVSSKEALEIMGTLRVLIEHPARLLLD